MSRHPIIEAPLLVTAGLPASFDLSGRTAVVTGAGRGLGRALALGIASAGADVAVVARSGKELETLAAEIEALGRRASVHVADVTHVSALPGLVERIVGLHGQIDVLVNNAGAKVIDDVLDVTEQAWDEVVDTNLKAAFFVAQAVGRHMVARGSGKVVNVCSTYSIRAGRGRASYAASKAGLLQLTRVMAIEWAGRGVNVNAVGPSAMATPMNDALFADEAWRNQALASIPAGRFVEPADIVGAVIFLASPASDMVHGQLLIVDGGRLLI